MPASQEIEVQIKSDNAHERLGVIATAHEHKEQQVIEISSDEECAQAAVSASTQASTSGFLTRRRPRAVPLNPKDIVVIESDEEADEALSALILKSVTSGAHKTRRMPSGGVTSGNSSKNAESSTASSRTVIDLTLTSSDSEQSVEDIIRRKSRSSGTRSVSPMRPPIRATTPSARHQLSHGSPAHTDREAMGDQGSQMHKLPAWQVLVTTDPQSESDELLSDAQPSSSPMPQPSGSGTRQTSPAGSRAAAPDAATPAKGKKAVRAPRQTKKAKETEERQRRETYAQELFRELNANVFGSRFPEDIPLRWNNRLVATAGRTCCRNEDGSREIYIELATKILDTDSRIRNTLAHELCHLASWIIDDKMNEVHGAIFKKWANEVMEKRPDITITTKHNYDIDYPYEWACLQCAKVYGRFSNSIDVTKVACKNCRGTLHPMFQTSTPKTPKTKVGGRLAASTPRDSPISATSMLVKSIQDLAIGASAETKQKGLGGIEGDQTTIEVLNQSFSLLDFRA